MSGIGLHSVLAALMVLGLVAALAWTARRGTFASLRRKGPIGIETAMPLGERRSLVIVSVEGRRLLLGLTPMQVSMVAELAPGRPFDAEVAARS